MIKIDLVTGFLGSGKTTFIRGYVKYLMSQNIKVGIIENDFGAINVDALLLQDLSGEKCGVEQIVGGNEETDWKRRMKAKLIAMAMEGYQRVVVEPSGIYDAETFFDLLYEEPLERWYQAGSVIAIVDAEEIRSFSEVERYLLTSQISNASKIIFSKINAQFNDYRSREELNEILREFQSSRILQKEEIITEDCTEYTSEIYESILQADRIRSNYRKIWLEKDKIFTSEFFMGLSISPKNTESIIKTILNEPDCGNIARVKGFVALPDHKWLQFNATKRQYQQEESEYGQEVFIVTGQNLQRDMIEEFLNNWRKTYE